MAGKRDEKRSLDEEAKNRDTIGERERKNAREREGERERERDRGLDLRVSG